ncbi:hypothetical protein [Clostridium sp. JNZ J1-5]|nr:hypothetical protein [Clostridium sp.]
MDGINFVNHLAEFIGETVTIFTTSGGESGSGFTGVLLSVNNCFVRLIAQIGTAPGCALGNCCTGFAPGNIGSLDGFRNEFDNEFTTGCRGNNNTGRFECRGNRIGAVVDIPISKIASFVHNAV